MPILPRAAAMGPGRLPTTVWGAGVPCTALPSPDGASSCCCSGWGLSACAVAWGSQADMSSGWGLLGCAGEPASGGTPELHSQAWGQPGLTCPLAGMGLVGCMWAAVTPAARQGTSRLRMGSSHPSCLPACSCVTPSGLRQPACAACRPLAEATNKVSLRAAAA